MAKRVSHSMSAGPPRIAIAIELDFPFPWHQDCYEGILQFADRAGWSCVVDPYVVGMSQESGIAHYQGVVGRIDLQAAHSINNQGIPAVNHWSGSPAVKELHNVLMDNCSAAKLASEHLVSCGFRRLAIAGPTEHQSDALFLRGIEECAVSHGIASPDVLTVDSNFESSRDGVLKVRQMFTHWLQGLEKPVGIMSRLAIAGRYLAQICAEVGLRVPEDVAILTLSGDNCINDSSTPTLSAVDQDYIRLGYEAAATLSELMQDKTVSPTTRLLAPRRLIVRDSTDVFHSSDPLISDAIRYIAAHCRQTLQVDELADALNISRRTLERRFEEVLGRSVYSEITRLRIELLQRMLIETETPIASLASECGFGSLSHFTQFFTRNAGVTPSAYRKQFRDTIPNNAWRDNSKN